jgi:hypothetical protein
MRERPVTYLDSNAVSDLARLRPQAAKIPGIAKVRAALCSEASRRTIALGQWLFSELSYIEQGNKRDDFLADMQFVNQLQHLQIFRASGEMMRLEVEAFSRSLKVNPVIGTALPRPLDDEEWKSVWREERRLLTESKSEFGSWEVEAEKRIALNYPDRKDMSARLAADWKVDSSGVVSTMVLRAMRALTDSLGLPRDETAWPKPEQLPTLWCNWSFRVTRDFMLAMAENPRKRQPGDFVDWCHFMTAAHADEFVTSDERFLEIAREAPGPKPEILSLEQWVARVRRE